MTNVKRECGDCTRCCEGWLLTEINGHSVHKGQPCYFLEKRCTIYKDRPEHPCRVYNCFWLESDELPMWMKPNLSNIIVSEKVHSENPELNYYDITETGKKIESHILNWIIHWALKNKKNIIYEIDGKNHVLGSAEFTTKLASIQR